MKKVANHLCKLLVEEKKEFQGSNLYGRYVGKKYVVYSYGNHFPLFVFHNEEWYENCDKYSVTTSKHRSQSRPSYSTIKLNTRQIQDLIIDKFDISLYNTFINNS